MMMLYDRKYIMEAYTKEIWQEGFQEGFRKGFQEGLMQTEKEIVFALVDMNFLPDQIAEAVAVSADTVKQWIAEKSASGL